VTGYVVAGYAVTLGGLASYALWVVRRERVLKRSAPRRDKS
jgi:hypothetical protein